MMSRVSGLVATIWLALAGVAGAADKPVVVELFTSQGCSSCPPADALLRELAPRDDVIALALHVDYWDYIGWEDSFAQAIFSERQKAYATVAGRRMVYTPQIIVGGVDAVVGNKPMAVAELIRKHSALPEAASLSVTRTGGTLRAEVAGQGAGPADVILVRYAPERTVDILRGENAGLSVTYANIVTEWRPLGRWSGTGEASFEVSISGDAPAVVLVQGRDHGPMLVARRVP